MVIVSTKFSDLRSRIVARSFFNSSPAIQSNLLGVLLLLSLSVSPTFLFLFLFQDLKDDVADATDAVDKNARMEGARGDPGSGESIIVADSSNAASLLLSLSSWFCFFFILFFGCLSLGFVVNSTDATASDAAAADANRVSFFHCTLVQIDCPILLLSLLLLLLAGNHLFLFFQNTRVSFERVAEVRDRPKFF
jgi:hypothetical protein